MANTEYVVSGTLLHNGEKFEDGSLFSTDDKTLEATLLRHGTLLSLEQYQRQAEANADVAAVQRALALRDHQATASAAKDDRIAELEAKLAQQAAAQEADKSGEDAADGQSDAANESEEASDSQPSEDNAEA